VEVLFIGIVLLGILLVWGVWILWSVSIYNTYSTEISIITILVFFIIWTVIKYSIFRKLLLLILGISIIFSISEYPKFFYINLINLLGLYTLYRFSLVQDLKFYFKDEYKISYAEAEKNYNKDKVVKFVVKTGTGQLINYLTFTGVGSLLMMKLDSQIGNMFTNKNTNQAVEYIKSVEEEATIIRQKIIGIYILVTLGYVFFEKNPTLNNYLSLSNPLRGVTQIELLLFPSEKETIDYAALKMPIQEKVAMNIQSINSAFSEIEKMTPDIIKYPLDFLQNSLESEISLPNSERLKPLFPSFARYLLIVNVVPSNSRIRIMNIKPKYYDGIKLKQGKYHIEVSKRGYETITKWIHLNKDININIKLDKI